MNINKDFLSFKMVHFESLSAHAVHYTKLAPCHKSKTKTWFSNINTKNPKKEGNCPKLNQACYTRCSMNNIENVAACSSIPGCQFITGESCISACPQNMALELKNPTMGDWKGEKARD